MFCHSSKATFSLQCVPYLLYTSHRFCLDDATECMAGSVLDPDPKHFLVNPNT
jgi:hypothetical protein